MTKTLWTFVVALACVATAPQSRAALRYVNVNSTNATPPYTNWATAASNIQDAVDAASAGDEIVVTLPGGGAEMNTPEMTNHSVHSTNEQKPKL